MCISLYMCTCPYMYLCICVSVAMCVCSYVYIYVCASTYRYIHMYPRYIPENTTNKLEREYQYTHVQDRNIGMTLTAYLISRLLLLLHALISLQFIVVSVCMCVCYMFVVWQSRFSWLSNKMFEFEYTIGNSWGWRWVIRVNDFITEGHHIPSF